MKDFSAATLFKLVVAYVVFSFVANIIGGIAIVTAILGGTCG